MISKDCALTLFNQHLMTSQIWTTMHFSRSYVIIFPLFIIHLDFQMILERQPTSGKTFSPPPIKHHLIDDFCSVELHGVVEWCCSSYVHDSGSGWKEVLRDDDTCLSQWGPLQAQATSCDWGPNQRYCHGLGWARSGLFFSPAARTRTSRHFPSGEIFSISH